MGGVANERAGVLEKLEVDHPNCNVPSEEHADGVVNEKQLFELEALSASNHELEEEEADNQVKRVGLPEKPQVGKRHPRLWAIGANG